MELFLKVIKISTYLFGGMVLYYDVTHDRPVWAVVIAALIGMNIAQDLADK